MSVRRPNRKRSLSESFCFGLPPEVFLEKELNLNEERRIIAWRLFLILIMLSTINATLHPPTSIAVGVAIVLMSSQSMFNTTRGINSAITMGKLAFTGILLGLATIMLCTDQPWFLIPWSACLIFAFLCHARINKLPNILPLVFLVSVLSTPQNPIKSLDQALWFVVTIVLLPIGLSTLAQWALWPASSSKLLNKRLASVLKKIEAKIEDIQERNHQRNNNNPSLSAYLTPGRVSLSLNLLRETEANDPKVHAKHLEWSNLILELDNWFNIFSEIDRVLSQSIPTHDLSDQDLEDLNQLKRRSVQLRESFTDPYDHTIDEPLKIVIPSSNSAALGPLLKTAYEVAERIDQTLVSLSNPIKHEIPSSPPQPKKPPAIQPMHWLTSAFAKDHEDSFIWAFKATLSAMIVLILVQSLNWPGINTALVTCVLVADNSLGSDFRKSIMRMLGALIGGFLAYVYILVLMPATSTIAGFLLAISPVLWISTWVAAATPRVSYIGVQIGYAFALTALDGSGPVTDLVLSRDRVIGILVGIVIAGLVNYLLWPQRSETLSSKRIAGILRNLAQTIRKHPAEELNEQVSETVLNALDSTLQDSLYTLEHAQFEPKAESKIHHDRNLRLRYIIHSLQYISNIILARHRFFLSKQCDVVTVPLEAQMNQMREAYGCFYDNLANTIESEAPMSLPNLNGCLASLNDACDLLINSETLNAHELSMLKSLMALETKLVNVMKEVAQNLAATETQKLEEKLQFFGLMPS